MLAHTHTHTHSHTLHSHTLHSHTLTLTLTLSHTLDGGDLSLHRHALATQDTDLLRPQSRLQLNLAYIFFIIITEPPVNTTKTLHVQILC